MYSLGDCILYELAFALFICIEVVVVVVVVVVCFNSLVPRYIVSVLFS